MRPYVALLAFLILTPLTPARAADTRTESRCGWIINMSPGNFSLRDKDAEWTLSEQGGYQAKGMDKIPDLSGDQFVDLGPHGYGCACIDGVMKAETHEVVGIKTFTQKKLKDCLADETLPYVDK